MYAMADQPDPTAERRARLATTENPARRLDYLVVLKGRLVLPKGRPGDDRPVELRYVPDRVILAPRALDAYLAALPPDSLEALVATVLADLNNELVPRWVAVALADGQHRVIAEDRQPNWDNPELLAHLAPF